MIAPASLRVNSSDISITITPEGFLNLALVKAFVDAGAVVAWLAAEGAFSWPGLFEEEDLVYAAHTDDGEFFIGSDLDEEMENLGQEELRFLRSRLIERKIIEPR